MKVAKVETFRTAHQRNVTVVRLTSEDGVQGLGETFFGSSAVETHVHDVVAPVLLDLPVVNPAVVEAALAGYVGYTGSGVETRARSAVDMALWDLLARRAGLPLRELLGGPVRDAVPFYNTCAGRRYVSQQSRQASENWGLPDGEEPGSMEDLWGFLNRPGDLAQELLDSGIRGMKIWPFDLAAEESGGSARADLRRGLSVLEQIRDRVGNAMELYVELHALWGFAGARRLLREIERFDLAWVEDPIRPDRVEQVVRLSEETDVPIATGETLAGRRAFEPLLQRGAINVAIIDLGWTGGISEARRIADAAAVHGIDVAPHDCTGPISLAAALHWVTSSPNGVVQEMSRAFYHGWYRDMVDELPSIQDGVMAPLPGPGLGVELSERFVTSPDTTVRVSGS